MTAQAEESLNLKIVAQIESSNNPKAYNRKSKATGLYQITPICLKHYNQVHGTSYVREDLYDPELNTRIAIWYFTWLWQRGLPNLDMILASYNWGLSNVRAYLKGEKEMPKETINYIKKYHKLKG